MHSTGKYSWAAISKLVGKATGQAFDYDSFQLKYDASPALQHLIADFSESGITLNVKKKQPEKEVEPASSTNQDGSSVNRAKKAAKHTLDRLK